MAKKANATKITSIKIQYPDGETKDLSLEDAEALHQQLDELFGSKTTVLPRPIVIEHDPYRYPRWPRLPVWRGDSIDVAMPPMNTKVWCCTN